MALKDEWKKTGQELGDAFTGLGKSLVRTAKVGADMTQNWAEDRDPHEGIRSKTSRTTEAGRRPAAGWATRWSSSGRPCSTLRKPVQKRLKTGQSRTKRKNKKHDLFG